MHPCALVLHSSPRGREAEDWIRRGRKSCVRAAQVLDKSANFSFARHGRDHSPATMACSHERGAVPFRPPKRNFSSSVVDGRPDSGIILYQYAFRAGCAKVPIVAECDLQQKRSAPISDCIYTMTEFWKSSRHSGGASRQCARRPGGLRIATRPRHLQSSEPAPCSYSVAAWSPPRENVPMIVPVASTWPSIAAITASRLAPGSRSREGTSRAKTWT